MKDQPFIVRQRANIHSSAPFNQNEDAVEKVKTAGQFIAQESFGQALKKFAGNVASKAFGVAGMLLTPQKAYGGGEFKSGSLSLKEQKKQFESIPEETSEQFLARTRNEG